MIKKHNFKLTFFCLMTFALMFATSAHSGTANPDSDDQAGAIGEAGDVSFGFDPHTIRF